MDVVPFEAYLEGESSKWCRLTVATVYRGLDPTGPNAAAQQCSPLYCLNIRLLLEYVARGNFGKPPLLKNYSPGESNLPGYEIARNLRTGLKEYLRTNVADYLVGAVAVKRLLDKLARVLLQVINDQRYEGLANKFTVFWGKLVRMSIMQISVPAEIRQLREVLLTPSANPRKRQNTRLDAADTEESVERPLKMQKLSSVEKYSNNQPIVAAPNTATEADASSNFTNGLWKARTDPDPSGQLIKIVIPNCPFQISPAPNAHPDTPSGPMIPRPILPMSPPVLTPPFMPSTPLWLRRLAPTHP